MAKVILKQYGDVSRLAKEFGVSKVTVWSALKGTTKSSLAHSIRERATKDWKRQVITL